MAKRKKPVSVTPRALADARREFGLVQIVEQNVSMGKKGFFKRDLFGFIDIIAISRLEIIGIQATSHKNFSSRVRKILAHENAAAWLEAPTRRLFVWSYGKNAAGRWYRNGREITQADLGEPDRDAEVGGEEPGPGPLQDC